MAVSGQIPDDPAKFLSVREAASCLSELISRRKPASFIRLGDGEAFILGHNDVTRPDELNHILNMWFGRHVVSEADIVHIRAELIKAIKAADLIGLHHPSMGGEEKFGRIFSVFNKYQLWNGVAKVCWANVHMHLHGAKMYEGLFQRLDFVGVISPRSIERKLSDIWQIKKIVRYDIPEEHFYAANKDSVGRHYPDRYYKLLDELEVPFEGAVFLVGAGVLGKIYCDKIKALGGIGLDLGSVFDAWAEYPARGNVRTMRLGL
jgi:hypothetical protein